MKSVFIGADKVVINKAYSRADVGYKKTQLSLMRINDHEKIGFFYLGEKYDNRLTKKGFILNLRKDLNNDFLIEELNECTTYLFLRNGNRGPHYFVGTSKKAKRLDKTHLLLDLNVAKISDKTVKELGGFQPLP